MTIKDLKAKLGSMDDSYTLTLKKPDGTEMDITEISQKGDHITFWTAASS